jgi:HK97 family phage prohead protease
MPLPTPRTDEDKDDFIARCMADEYANSEFPDQNDRAGYCYGAWEDRNKTMDKMRVKGLITKGAEDAVYSAIASNAAVDRDNEIIMPTAFKNLAQYLKSNPVIYYDHAWATWDAPREETLPIGKAVNGKIDEESGLLLSWKFTDLEFAQKVKHLVDIGVLNTVSVGFIPKVWDINSEGTRVYTDVELLELSVIGIPSNREAEIQRSLTAKGFKPPQIEEVKSILHDLDSSGPTPEMSEAGAVAVEPRGRKGLRFGTSTNVKTVKLGGRFYEKR